MVHRRHTYVREVFRAGILELCDRVLSYATIPLALKHGSDATWTAVLARPCVRSLFARWVFLTGENAAAKTMNKMFPQRWQIIVDALRLVFVKKL